MGRKWIAIRASAVLAIAGSLATLVMGGAVLFGTLAAPATHTGPAMPPLPLKAIGMVMAAICACLSGWGIGTAIGIFRRREWARISIVVFAVLLTFMGASAFLAMLFVQMPVQPGVGQHAKMQTMMREMPRLFPTGVPPQMPQPGWLFALMGATFLTVPVWFLARRRDAFVKAAGAP